MRLTRASLFEAMREGSSDVDSVYASVLQQLNVDETTLDPAMEHREWVAGTKARISRFLYSCKQKLQSVGRHRSRFLDKFKDWLAESEEFSLPENPTKKRECPTQGRPEVDFGALSERGKRARTEGLRSSKTAEEISYAAQMKLRQSGQGEAASVVKRVVTASPRTLHMFCEFMKAKEKGTESEGPRSYSVEEALAHQYECKLTKQQYIYNRLSLIEHKAKLFPSYERLLNYRKANCYPSGITVTEVKASVTLQDLVDHTATRLAMSVEDVLKAMPAQSSMAVTLISKTGFDASSHHSVYNQRWMEQSSSDDSMLLTSLVPLLLVNRDEPNDKETILWINQRPSSTLYCRPIELEFTKETTEKIKEHNKYLEQSTKNLKKSVIEIGNLKLECAHEIYNTMVDGKVSSAATNTSNQNCNVCKATPKLMNDIARLKLRECDTTAYKYGISILHAHIRCLEYMLNLAYRLEIKKGYVQYTAQEKQSMASRKKSILKRIKDEIGLNLDQPGKSGGNTNTGNNARRFFDNCVKVTEITGLHLDALKRLRVILRTVSCGYSINPNEFQKFAEETAQFLVTLYPWYYMPSSVHTLLLHGADYIRYFPVPLGMLSEEALESRHKDLRFLRLHHSRKSGRVVNMHDMFHGLLCRSDPIIAYLRKPPKPKNPLDREVLQLISTPDEDGVYAGLDPILEADDSEDEDDPDEWEV